MSSEGMSAFTERILRDNGDKMPTIVMLTPSDYASKLVQTRRPGGCSYDFGDCDGLCTFFMRGEDLWLRTAQCEAKLVVDGDWVQSCREEGVSHVPSSPLGASPRRAMQLACRASRRWASPSRR